METLISPEKLDIGMTFRLTGDACNPAETANDKIYTVTNKDMAHEFGAHLLVKAEGDEDETEIFVLPWVKVFHITEDA
jgi:hypothetical protein